MHSLPNLRSVVISGDEGFYNARIKLYPDDRGNDVIREIMVASKPIFNPHQLVSCQKPHQSAITKEALAIWGAEEASSASFDRLEHQKALNLSRAKRRARNRLYDLAACNRFDLFATITLDPQKCNRYDYSAIVKKLGQWLDNRVRRNGLKYLIVPEYHKDGAIHFHGLLNASALKLADSGHKYKDGRPIYHLAQWELGFTTVIPLTGDYAAVCAYLCKYITKQNEAPGGRYYLSGGKLSEPRFQYLNIPFEQAQGNAFEVPQAALSMKIFNP